jgi:nucleotide-binding universal stress UspA family protein
MRIIMVPVADRPESIAALDSAMSLAAHLSANVHACHIRPHRYSTVRLPAEASYLLPADELPEFSAADRKSAETASKAAKELVEKIAASRNFTVRKQLNGTSERNLTWKEEVGHVEQLMPIIGPFADLIVVSRPKRANSRIARLFMEQALLYSSRPVLILPHGRRLKVGRRVVIGWDQTQNAMRSVVAAIPILQRADEVSILTSGTGKAHGAKAGQLLKYLRAWGIDANATRTRGSDDNEAGDLEAHLQDVNADLLVMGSYSRHRLRQRLFGGVTDHFLAKSKTPVLMTHG